MHQRIQQIKAAIEPLREQIIQHPLYSTIQTPAQLRVFMQHHVYAVWDFMSLLKALQNNLTCTRVPWVPVGTADTRFLINEIVVGEESDVDMHGTRKSHFELYLEAMEEAGADTSIVKTLVQKVTNGVGIREAISGTPMPAAAADFMNFTFDVIDTGLPHVQAAVFTFGREDLIPNMFLSMVNDLHAAMPGKLSTFKYYLDRHIEVDGDHHSHLALQMTEQLCGDNEQHWELAAQYSMAALQHRIGLWDAAWQQLKSIPVPAMAV